MSSNAGRWSRFTAALPMRTALLAVAAVWLLGCVWSYHEQAAFAAANGFGFPHLLPLVIDGFAVSMAGVAWAASLDARPAIPARLATLIAVAASSASNGMWAWVRADRNMVTVVIAVAVPIAANLAFEVLLAELRRQVQRRRGLPAPVVVPHVRLIRLVLAPWSTFRAWRSLVLELTAPDNQTYEPALPTRTERCGQLSRGDEDPLADLVMRVAKRIERAQREGQSVPGRRRLARELGTTEYQVRAVLPAALSTVGGTQ